MFRNTEQSGRFTYLALLACDASRAHTRNWFSGGAHDDARGRQLALTRQRSRGHGGQSGEIVIVVVAIVALELALFGFFWLVALE